jgi:uncharacterized protein
VFPHFSFVRERLHLAMLFGLVLALGTGIGGLVWWKYSPGASAGSATEMALAADGGREGPPPYLDFGPSPSSLAEAAPTEAARAPDPAPPHTSASERDRRKETLRRLADRTRGLVPPVAEIFRPLPDEALAVAESDLAATLDLLRSGRLSEEQLDRFLPWMRHLADAGDLGLQRELARLLADGVIPPESASEALGRALVAAEAGDPEAAMLVARALEQGLGTSPDPALAREWYAYAGEQGLPDAWAELGFLASLGSGEPIDHTRALALYERAYAEGSALGARRLGIAHREGWGVDRDLNLAREWLELAGAQGDAVAYLLLREDSIVGTYGPRDRAQEDAWLLAAASLGEADAVRQWARRELYRPEGDATAAVRTLVDQAAAGAPEAMVDLAQVIIRERDPSRLPEAETLLRMAGELGSTAALKRLAMLNAHPAMRPHLATPQDPADLLRASIAQSADYHAQLVLHEIENGLSPPDAFRRHAGLSREEAYIRWNHLLRDQPAALPPDASPEEIAIHDLDRRPSAISFPSPLYPPSLRAEGVTGEVRLSFWIMKDGSVSRIEVLESSHPLFSQSAVEAAEKWRFEPGERDGEAVNTIARISIPFNIDP